ncbi:O-antigen ligase domain-containing protein [Clostridiales bacterium AF36-10]|nr:O-antigen ligase domain-containing protein [Clostridiales bacterium AF36-10]
MLKTNMYCITIVIYLCSFYMYSYIGAIPRAVITMGMLLSTLLVIAQRKLKPNKQFLLITLGTIVPLLTFVIRNYDIQNGYYGRFLCFTTAVFLIVSLYAYDDWIPICVYSYKWIGSLFAIFTIINGVAPVARVMASKFFRTAGDLFLDTSSRVYNAGIAITVATNALYLVVGIITILFSYRSNIITKLMGVSIGTVALLLTGKRGQFLACVIAILGTLIIKAKPNIKRIMWVLVILLVPLYIAIIFSCDLIPDVSFIFDNDATSGRTALYYRAIELFMQNPLWGNGWASYRYLSNMVYLNNYYEVHNVYLQLLAETGVIGFLIFITIFSKILWTCVNTYHKIHDDGMSSFLAISIAGQSFMLIYSLTGNVLYDQLYLIAYAVFCAMGLACCHKYSLSSK